MKRATGSNEALTNIPAHIAMERAAAITRSEKNLVDLGLHAMALKNPAPGLFVAAMSQGRAKCVNRSPFALLIKRCTIKSC